MTHRPTQTPPRILEDRLEKLQSITLETGSHTPDGRMCVMEAVAWVAGEPWSDSPACVSMVMAEWARQINDEATPAARDRLKGMVPLFVGTATSEGQVDPRMWTLVDSAVRQLAPRALRATGLLLEAEKLETLKPICNAETVEAASSAADAASYAAYTARSATDAASYAANAARYAANAARSAADAASYAANAARSAAEAACSAADAARSAIEAACYAAYAARSAVDAARYAAYAAGSAADASWNVWDAALTAGEQALKLEVAA